MNLAYLFPEAVAGGILFILLLGEILRGRAVVSGAPVKTLAAGCVLVLAGVFLFAGKFGAAFGGMFILDPLASFFKVLLVLFVAVGILMSRDYFEKTGERTGEFFLLLWSLLLGLFFLVSANDFLLLFLALEIVTLSFYVLAAYHRHERASIEAGLKYLVLGSLASALVIFGIGLIYVVSGSTAFVDVRGALTENPQDRLMLLGILFVFSGLGFKTASVPFQFWVPDVYEGAPLPVTALLATASKAAGFAVLLRLFFTVFVGLDPERTSLVSVLAAMTLIYGSLGAIPQKNLKRLFGYSSIGHAGYLLTAFASGGEGGSRAILYYWVAYGISNLAAFYVMTLVGRETHSQEIESYRGLAKRSPYLAGMFFLALLSLAGIPPLGGFFAKFLVLLAAVHSGLGWLALLGTVLVAVSLYYYLNIVRAMYFEAPSERAAIPVALHSKILLTVLASGIILTGVWQAPFLEWASQAARSLF